MTTPAELEARWTEFRNPTEEDEGVSLDEIAADSFVVVYADQGGAGAEEVDLRLALSFESPADCAAFLRYSELPRCVAWDSGSRAEPVEDYYAYLGGYNDDRRDGFRACAAELEAVVTGASNDIDAAIARFNVTCAITEPRLFVIAWGDVAAVLLSPKFDEDFAEMLSYEPDGQVAELLAALKGGTFDATNPEHLELATIALEELEEY